MTSDETRKEQSGATLATKLKIAGTITVAVLVLIVVLQNTDPVNTQLLFASVEMPRAVLLFVMLAIGFGTGVLVTGSLYRRRAKR